MDITQSPGLPEPEGAHAMVVYDPSTGIILHRHMRYPGGRVQERHELETRALELAAARGVDTRRLRVLYVDHAALAEEVEHRVDVDRQTLACGRPLSLTNAELLRRAQRSSR